MNAILWLRTKKYKPPYKLIGAGVFAFVLSALITHSFFHGEWKTRFSYEYQASIDPSWSSAMGNLLSSGSMASDNSVIAHAGFLQSETFFRRIESHLKAQGVRGWDLERIAQAIHITKSVTPGRVQVDIQAPSKDMTEALASAFHQSYMSHLKEWGTGLQQTEHEFLASLKPSLSHLEATAENAVSGVKRLSEVPVQAAQSQNLPNLIINFVLLFGGVAGVLYAAPVVSERMALHIPRRSLVTILNGLLKTKKQTVVMMLPVSSLEHLTASLYLGGLLNQFGRNTIVMDADLNNRLLSRKVPAEHPHGVFEHLLDSDMKKPFHDPVSGAKVIPLETSLPPSKGVEFTQVIQRLPRVWERWPNSIVILDIGKWHEGYHQLLPYVSQVIFYTPSYQEKNLLLPQIFKRKYQVPVSLVEIHPDL